MKKKKVDPVKHEQEYIEFLEKQIVWKKANSASIEEIKKLEYKLSKARLVLKILSVKK
jgi:hypothetical protein